MTPKERVRKFFKKEPVDTMPLFSGMGTVTIQAIEKMGVRFAEIHTDAELMGKSAMTSLEMWGMDGAVVPYDMCIPARGHGPRGDPVHRRGGHSSTPRCPPNGPPWTRWTCPRSYEGLFGQARMPVVDGALKYCLDYDGGKYAVGGWVLGPFTLGGQIIELDVLLKGVAKDKKRVNAFLDSMTDYVITMAKHYQDIGVDYISIREMGSGTDLLSPRMWKTLIKPNLEKVFAALNVPTINHICGGTDLIVEMMADCGADAISVDQKNNVAQSREKLGDDVIILGNFDPYKHTGAAASPAAVEGIIKKCIDDGVDAVWPGCDLWPDVQPEESMKIYVNDGKAQVR